MIRVCLLPKTFYFDCCLFDCLTYCWCVWHRYPRMKLVNCIRFTFGIEWRQLRQPRTFWSSLTAPAAIVRWRWYKSACLKCCRCCERSHLLTVFIRCWERLRFQWRYVHNVEGETALISSALCHHCRNSFVRMPRTGFNLISLWTIWRRRRRRAIAKKSAPVIRNMYVLAIDRIFFILLPFSTTSHSLFQLEPQENTSSSAITSVFKFLDQKLHDASGNSKSNKKKEWTMTTFLSIVLVVHNKCLFCS
jgi:hypothetical protein